MCEIFQVAPMQLKNVADRVGIRARFTINGTPHFTEKDFERMKKELNAKQQAIQTGK
ncbi:MAG TPA: hypothetical protein VGG19_06000 [Tepidisphaeraceae bacterium]